jgi:SAM-dependent methyltransferase
MTNTAKDQGEVLERLQNVWETHAKDDPLWAIISTPGKMGGKWDLNEFLQTGRHEIDQLLETLSSNDIEFERSSALDFGCGVGRLTQALARSFESVCGVDISPTMIENARKLNQYHGKCRYYLNARQDLRLFHDDRFSFIYSSMVLQHMSPGVARNYLAEFGRILKPGGLLVFQLPSLFKNEEGLPPAAWVISIQCAAQQLSWPPSSRATIAVTVQNGSPVLWQYEPRQPIMLGNHWCDETGRIIRLDDGRAMVPNRLAPGEKVDLALDIRTPPAPGSYALELDLVQEGVAWFKDKGAQTLQLPVEILGQLAGAPVSPNDADLRSAENLQDEPVPAKEAFEGFSMHCIPRHEVVALLYQHGMRLEFIEASDKGGPGYQSYFYFARAVTRPVAVNSTSVAS